MTLSISCISVCLDVAIEFAIILVRSVKSTVAVLATKIVLFTNQFQEYQIQNKQPKVGKHIKEEGNMDVWTILTQKSQYF